MLERAGSEQQRGELKRMERPAKPGRSLPYRNIGDLPNEGEGGRQGDKAETGVQEPEPDAQKVLPEPFGADLLESAGNSDTVDEGEGEEDESISRRSGMFVSIKRRQGRV